MVGRGIMRKVMLFTGIHSKLQGRHSWVTDMNNQGKQKEMMHKSFTDDFINIITLAEDVCIRCRC